jgi:geranylgeranyl diphosphate synthase type 3
MTSLYVILHQAFDGWLQISNDKKKQIKEITQMLHNASLIIDDIEDNSLLRRGIPVCHRVYGIPSAINSANYIYFLAMNKTLQLGDVKAINIFTEQLIVLHRGQGKDIYWRDSSTCPTEDEYRTMVKEKTGGLFQLAVDLMQLFSQNQSDFNPLLELLGLFFQIRDDYANLMLTEYTDNKGFCEDLTEGKFSFPIIHGISHSNSSQLMNILKQRTTDIDLKKHFLQVLEDTGSFAYTVKVLSELETKALQEIERLGGNEILEQIIDKLSHLYKRAPSPTGNAIVPQ